MNLSELQGKWNELKKAISHKTSIADAAVPAPKEPKEFPQPTTEHLKAAKYGTKNIPGAESSEIQNPAHKSVGYTEQGSKGYILRHGAPAHRTAVEHEMAKLIGADHMLPEQSYDPGMHHPEHHQHASHNVDQHGGTSLQEHVEGEDLHGALEDEKLSGKLREQWKSGDLHKLWALHYISNNGDMHSGNFKVSKDGVKAFDSDHAFYELPQAHSVWMHGDTPDHEPALEYNPHSFSQLPSYLSPFLVHQNDEGIEPVHKDEQLSSADLREHAKQIDPDLFIKFGKHAAERAKKAKQALTSADPTKAMLDLWHDHRDKTKGTHRG